MFPKISWPINQKDVLGFVSLIASLLFGDNMSCIPDWPETPMYIAKEEFLASIRGVWGFQVCATRCFRGCWKWNPGFHAC